MTYFTVWLWSEGEMLKGETGSHDRTHLVGTNRSFSRNVPRAQRDGDIGIVRYDVCRLDQFTRSGNRDCLSLNPVESIRVPLRTLVHFLNRILSLLTNRKYMYAVRRRCPKVSLTGLVYASEYLSLIQLRHS